MEENQQKKRKIKCVKIEVRLPLPANERTTARAQVCTSWSLTRGGSTAAAAAVWFFRHFASRKSFSVWAAENHNNNNNNIPRTHLYSYIQIMIARERGNGENKIKIYGTVTITNLRNSSHHSANRRLRGRKYYAFRRRRRTDHTEVSVKYIDTSIYVCQTDARCMMIIIIITRRYVKMSGSKLKRKEASETPAAV